MSKKKYICPDVYCESFILSQHIASCGLLMNQADEKTCTGQITEGMVEKDPIWGDSLGDFMFTEATTGCVVIDEKYCYTNSTDSSPLFGS